MQDIVHDAHSFATQITAKGACRYTNTTRNPPHRASQGGKAGNRAVLRRAPKRATASFSRFLGKLSVGEPPRFCSKSRVVSVSMREKARRSFHICKTPGREHWLRGFQKVPHPLDAYNSRFAAKTGVFADRRPRHLLGRRGWEGRPRSPPTGKIAHGFARGSQGEANRCLSGAQRRQGRSSRRASETS